MFTIISEDKHTKARLGQWQTAHGSLPTPAFFPVATQAAVKGLHSLDLSNIGINGLLVNAYHLFLRPGTKIIKKCGGLHQFMNFNKTIITDSGGYQIFSLEGLRKISEQGVKFKSHIDGKSFFLTPEDVVQIQVDLGSDVVIPLDECVKYPTQHKDAQLAAWRTNAWLKRSKEFLKKQQTNQQFFGIIQGSTFLDLRQECLEQVQACGVDGLCYGGLSIGETADLRYNVLSLVEAKADKRYLRYFMGHGKPNEILEAVSLGVDLFDCILPTRLARTGTAFSRQGEMVIRNSPYAEDREPIDKDCGCYVCRNFSRAYLRHLINVNEMLGAQLLAYHNVFWYKSFMDDIRAAIEQNNFSRFKKDFLANYGGKEIDRRNKFCGEQNL
jgi:queuine tRNA-ribosyltransferase